MGASFCNFDNRNNCNNPGVEECEGLWMKSNCPNVCDGLCEEMAQEAYGDFQLPQNIGISYYFLSFIFHIVFCRERRNLKGRSGYTF